MIDNGICPYFAVVADVDISENLGPGPDVHIVAYLWHAIVTFPYDDANMNSQIIAYMGFVVYYYDAKMGNT
nr:hypothetical protein [Bifidobacterium callitrichos]